MSKFNDNIVLTMRNSNKEFLSFKGFANIPTEKAVAQLKKKFITTENMLKYPFAHIKVNNVIVHNYIQGVEVSNNNTSQLWYGKDISAYKMKIKLLDQTDIGPFYSNSFASKQMQLDNLILEYLENKYAKQFISALVFDITEEAEKLAAKALYSEKKGLTIQKY